MRWRIRDHEGRLHIKRSQASTAGEARRRAYEKVDHILRSTADMKSTWSTADTITDFLDQEVLPIIESKRLSDTSKERYLGVLAHYRRYTKGKSIASCATAPSLIKTLKVIADEVGIETARQTRSVVSNYVFQQLILHQLVQSNPIRGVSLDFLKSETQEINTFQHRMNGKLS